MPSFAPGLELNERFHREVIAPLLAGVRYSAARLGWGSDVLGYDTERSTDHGWGPQLLIVVRAGGVGGVTGVTARLDEGLPEQFEGWPVRYGWDDTPVSHHIVVSTLADWSVQQLGVDATADHEPAIDQWLTMPQQKLLETVSGAVYRDDDGSLTALRARLAWYPDDIWLWLIACQWRRVSQEEAFVGRTAEVGDELGSRIVTARMVREVMRLWYLFSRRYWPYAKWFGTAFARLPGVTAVAKQLAAALAADDYRARERALAAAYQLTVVRHNELGLTAPVDPAPRPFYSRPFEVIMADRIVDACRARFSSRMAPLPLVGSIDQLADSTDFLNYPPRTSQLAPFYRHLCEVSA